MVSGAQPWWASTQKNLNHTTCKYMKTKLEKRFLFLALFHFVCGHFLPLERCVQCLLNVPSYWVKPTWRVPSPCGSLHQGKAATLGHILLQDPVLLRFCRRAFALIHGQSNLWKKRHFQNIFLFAFFIQKYSTPACSERSSIYLVSPYPLVHLKYFGVLFTLLLSFGNSHLTFCQRDHFTPY